MKIVICDPVDGYHEYHHGFVRMRDIIFYLK